MHDTTSTRQPGRPQVCFPCGERVQTTETREGGPIRVGESDRLIIPMKARRLLRKWFNRRGGRRQLTWEKFVLMEKRFPLPKPRITVHLLPTW